MQTLYFNQYKKASEYSLTLQNIDNSLIIRSSSFYTEIGECPCFNIEDENFVIVYRIFYDFSLYELQDNFDKY